MTGSMCGPQTPPNGTTAVLDSNSDSAVPVVKQDASDLYKSDEFRLFCFKVLPCSKRFVHDWPSCPFAHPGEKAKRRDPRTHQYDCEMCPAVVKGEVCELGAACPHSHHVFESWLHPQKYRTLLCKDGDQCHREVCFFAHGSKQLRTPERSQQQRLPQQRFSPMAESAHKQQAASRGGSSTNSSYHNGRHGGYQQMTSSGSGSSLAAGSSNSSASTNIPAMAQLQGFPACAPYAQQQQQQALMTSALLSQADGGSPMQLQALLGANGNVDGNLSQLLQSIAAEASASKQEAAEHNRAAAMAQQKLELLEQLLNCNGAAQGICSTPLTSPVAGAWQLGGGAPQQLPLSGPQLAQLLHMQQQMAAHRACEEPRRQDESLLRRVRNSPANGLSNLGRGAGLGNASPSAARYNLAAVNEGVALGMPSDAAAQADLDALAAACAAAGLPVNSLLNRGQGMQFGGAGVPPPASAALAAAQLSGGSNAGWMAPQQQGVDAGMWAQLGGAWGVAAAPVSAYHSGQHLPPIPFNSAALVNGNSSISAPQLQSDYLLQLHAALQANAMNAAPTERASFDVAAAYLPPMPAGLLAGRTAAAELLAAAEDVAGTPNGSVHRSSGQSNVQDSAAAAPVSADKLVANPIGGAGQLGWF